MKRLLMVVVVCFSLPIFSYSQVKPRLGYSLDWSTGTVLFQTEDTLACTLRYNQTLSIGALQIMQGDDAITIPSTDVKEFRFYDKGKGRWRKFTSMNIEGEEPLNQKFFLEHVYYDKQFAILNHRTVDVPFDYMNYTRLISKPIRMTKKYLFDSKTGALLPLSKENALKLLDYRSEVISFIHENHLRFKTVADYIDIFQYNSSL